VRGTNVCKTHGAAAPQVRAKAALRLAMMLDPALKVYAEVLETKGHLCASPRAAVNISRCRSARR
jgi:hypothetical protein